MESFSAERLRLPAEWEAQDGVMLTWPHEHSDWLPFLPEVERTYVVIAREICRRERLLVCARDGNHVQHVRECLRNGGVDASRCRVYVAPSNDSWARDHGPVTVLADDAPRLLDFVFNGWGGKYEAGLDNQITPRLHAAGAFGATPLQPVDFVLEGGGIESDGQGTLLTTARCLLSASRNPGLTRSGIEARLARLFGLQRVLWLEHGYLEGDDTDSHIDTLARFCDPGTIAYVRCDDPADPHFAELAEMERELRALRDAAGRAYRLVALPWPAARYSTEGRRLPATYANFLVINGAVLMPAYQDGADSRAVAALRECFPEREIIPVDCVALIQQFGSLHCITMQLPAGVLASV